MLEPQDIQKLTEILATKDDINRLEKRMLNLETESVNIGQRLTTMEDRLANLEETVSNLVTVTDRLVGRVEMLHQEYLVLKERDTRYERWFHEIAEKVGITLTP